MYYKYKQVTTKGSSTIFATTSKNSSIVMALWDQDIYGLAPTYLPWLFINPIDATLCPIRIDYFLKVSYFLTKFRCCKHSIFCAWFMVSTAFFSV